LSETLEGTILASGPPGNRGMSDESGRPVASNLECGSLAA